MKPLAFEAPVRFGRTVRFGERGFPPVAFWEHPRVSPTACEIAALIM